jgi:tetratricopeptide (TPR) repeat protein
LEKDTQELLNAVENPFFSDELNEYQYMLVPTVLRDSTQIILCKTWIHKKWDQVKKFAKKHKKALIIGAAVVVAATIVVIAVAATSAAAGAAAGAAGAVAATAEDHCTSTETSAASDMESILVLPDEGSMIAMSNQIYQLKENLLQDPLFQETTDQTLSAEETGRIIGSLLAHDVYHQQVQNDPLRALDYSLESILTKHSAIDTTFSTDYTFRYIDPAASPDLKRVSHQICGDKAMQQGYFEQAIRHYDRAIGMDSRNGEALLDRSLCHFHTENYDKALDDYARYTAQFEPMPMSHIVSISEVMTSFQNGLTNGICESGKSSLLFIGDTLTHPVRTLKQTFNAISHLVTLAKNNEWETVGKAVSPELHELITEWESLSHDQRAELAGYALGKHGADLATPAAVGKAAKVSITCAEELTSFCKNIKIAHETLILETAAEIGNGVKIAEVIEGGQHTVRIAEELGYNGTQIGQLKKAGQLETTVAKDCAHLSLPMQESINLFEEARKKLKPHQGKYMPEMIVRELIHETGLPTFPRPKGIPENYRVKLSDRGSGMKYVHPKDESTYVRIMPGKPHSPYPYQRSPYVVQMKNGKTLDKFGNVVLHDSHEAHIPISEFVYTGERVVTNRGR